MAELDIRQPESNIYSNVEDSEALPLFVRYTSDDAKFHDKDAQVSFEETIAQLSGMHTCSFIHRRQKGRNKVYFALREKGVPCNVHYKPLPMMTAYKSIGFDINNFPNAYDMFKNEITLPLHTLLSDEDVDYVIECYKKVLSEVL